MKMTKKLMLAAVALTAVMFASCNLGGLGSIGDVKFSTGSSGDGTRNYKVKGQVNEEDHTIRGMKKVGLLKRAQGTCVVKLYDQSTGSRDGMTGFVCDYTKNEDGTVNFLVVGITNDLNRVYTYASYFYNIDTNKLSEQNFGCSATKAAYDATATGPYEVEVLPYPASMGTFKNSNYDLKDDKNTFEAAIKFTTGESGNIQIDWYDPTQYEAQYSSAQCHIKDGAVAKKTLTVLQSQRKGAEEAEKGSLYIYANIYEGKTLNAEWEIYDVSFKAEKGLSAIDEDASFGEIDFE